VLATAALTGPSRTRAALALLVPPLLYGALAWPAVWTSSATYDETEHVPAGYVYVTRGDYRLGPEHPPLLKQLFGAALLPLTPRVSADAERAFTVAARDIDAHWIFGDRFLYKDNAPTPLLARARLVSVALAAVLVLVVHLWTREVFGRGAGWVAALLAALDPTLLAHGSLATTDAGFTTFFVAAAYLARRTFQRLTLTRAVAFALAVAAAFASKHSAVLLAPVLALMALARVADADPWPARAATVIRSWQARALAVTAILVAAALLAWGGLWAAYGFRWSATVDGTPLPTATWRASIAETAVIAEVLRSGGAMPDAATLQRLVTTRSPGAAERALAFLEEHHLLPESYVFGIAFATAMGQVRWTYFLGESSLLSSPWYFPFAVLVKTPLATLMITLAAVVLLGWRIARGRRLARDTGPERAALAIGAVIAAVLLPAMLSTLNIGIRHVLPALPFVWMLAGYAVSRIGAGRRLAIAAASAAVICAAAETLAARPYYLPFFNVAAGGARGGLRLLSDSNLDWGQALPPLRAWMERAGVRRVNLAYFGTADPAAYGIGFVPLAGTHVIDVPGAGRAGYLPRPPELPGWVAISATHLQGTYLTPALRQRYAPFSSLEPAAVVGDAIYVYRVDRWPD
jgi:hypothetical protein